MHPGGRKAISIPVRGKPTSVDVHDFLGLIDHPLFQRLRYITQLGVTLMYPAATHTRFEHSLGVLEETRRRLACWRGQFDKITRFTILAYSLLHDIGHTAFSHATEGMIGHDHQQTALRFIGKMKKIIIGAKVNYDLLVKMFKGESALHEIVGNHPLGSDKIDYLTRDALHTNMDYPNVDYLDGHVYWKDDRLVIVDTLDMIRRAIRYREIYISAYGEIYLRRGGVNAQRLIERMWEYEMELGRSRRQIANATEFEALTWFKHSKSEACRRLAKLYLNRIVPKTAIAFRLSGCKKDENTAKRNVAVFEIARDTFLRLGKKYNTPSKLTMLEKEIEKELQLKPDSIIVTPQFHGERYYQKPIWIWRDNQPFSLDELYPEDTRPARILAERYTAWRISTLRPHIHDKVFRAANAIFEMLTDC